LIKRMYPIVLICFLSIPLLFAQDSQSNNSPPNIGGAWQITWEGRGGSQQATIQFQQEGSKLSGTFQGSAGGSSQLTGNVAGNTVSFSVQIQGGRTITLAFTGTIDGDKMSGTFQPQGGGGGRGGHGGGGGQGNHSWTGVRQQSGQSEPQQDQEEDDEYGA